MILVDTSVWSLALRRSPRKGQVPRAAQLLRKLIEDGQPVALPGAVLQELLSGLRHRPQFDRLRKVLDPFPLVLATREDHIQAAEVVNTCRSRGVQAGTIDALIVALTLRTGGILVTADQDFQHIQDLVSFPLQLMPSA